MDKYVDEIMDIVDNETGELDLEHQRLAIQQQIRKAQLDVLEECLFIKDTDKAYPINTAYLNALRKINQLKETI